MLTSLLAAIMTLDGALAEYHARHNCARIFKNHNAGGWEERIDASRPISSHDRLYYCQDDDMGDHCSNYGTSLLNNAVSSFKVPSGCYFQPFCNYNFNYGMDIFVGPTSVNLVGSWNDCISSYRCWCEASEWPEYATSYPWDADVWDLLRRRIAGGKNSTESTVPPLVDLLDEELDEPKWVTYSGRKNASTNKAVLEGALEGMIRDLLANPTNTDVHRDELIIDIEKALFLERHPNTEMTGQSLQMDKKEKRKAKRKLQKAALKERLAAAAAASSD